MRGMMKWYELIDYDVVKWGINLSSHGLRPCVSDRGLCYVVNESNCFLETENDTPSINGLSL
jgi:hypothetical protein